MNSFFIVCILILRSVIAEGFDLKDFVENHCSLESFHREVELRCSNFKFSKSVVDDIQNNDFVITNLTRIHFQNCDIGIVNDNFFAKFPRVEEFRFHNVIFTTAPATKGFILPSALKVTELIIAEGKMTHTPNCNFLRSMPNLDYFHMESVDVHFKSMDRNFFQNNPKISWITLKNLSFVNFEEGVFDSIVDLKALFIENLKLELIPKNLFTKNMQLKSIFIDHCGLQKVPELSYPKYLHSLSLSYNNITNITSLSFKNLENVSLLKLDKNNIGNFRIEVFDELKNLTIVDLSNNNITEISKDHFPNLEAMTLIDLRFNDIKSTDLEEFVHVNVFLRPSRKEKTEQEDDEKEDRCGCGHAWTWTIVLLLFLCIFGGAVGFIAWRSSLKRPLVTK